MPPPRPRSPPVRALRAGSPDRGAGTRRRAGHLRRLLSPAQRRLQRLRCRATELLSGGTGDVPAAMSAVLDAICAARNPRTALNWLRNGASAVILADIAAGRAAATHQALDQHPRPRAAGFLRQMLTA